MLKFQQVSISERATLQRLIEQNIDLIELGMKPVFSTMNPPSTSSPFFFARDETGRAVLIQYDLGCEVQLLYQTLEHFDWLSNHLTLISQLIPQGNLVPTLKPRLLFVLPQYPSAWERHLKCLRLTPEFYTFLYLAVHDECGLLITPHQKRDQDSLGSAFPKQRGQALSDEEEVFFNRYPENH